MIAIVTCAEHFYAGVSHEHDDQRLLAALHAFGLTARAAMWDDPGVDWSAFSLCIIRSAWDYHHRRDAFLAWAERVAGTTILCNPLPVIQWNTHKYYLRELETRGVPVVPTEWLAPGESVCLAERVRRRAWSRFVIKPAVATNSFGARIFSRESLDEGQAHLDKLLCAREVMLQPFLPSIAVYGERSLVFIEGELTHAFRKRPAFEQQRDTQGEIAVSPTRDEAALAKEILSHAAHITGQRGSKAFLFARVDLVRDERGAARLMELELVEPRLRLDIAPRALGRLVRAIDDRQQGHAYSVHDRRHVLAS
jgi:glutathione synthase/RimK-type ligase-like ATP-grasp enzyme